MIGRKFALMAVGCLTFNGPVLAADGQEWVTIGITDGMTWEGRAGSVHLTKDNGGNPIYAAMGRITNTKTKVIEFQYWYVKVSDCQRGSGKVVSTDMDGNYQFENDFVLGGGNIASSLADVICYPITSAQKKGFSG